MGVARPPKPADERKVAFTTRLDPDLYYWFQERSGVGKRFASLTHAIETGLARLREEEEGSPSRSSRSPTSKK